MGNGRETDHLDAVFYPFIGIVSTPVRILVLIL